MSWFPWEPKVVAKAKRVAEWGDLAGGVLQAAATGGLSAAQDFVRPAVPKPVRRATSGLLSGMADLGAETGSDALSALRGPVRGLIEPKAALADTRDLLGDLYRPVAKGMEGLSQYGGKPFIGALGGVLGESKDPATGQRVHSSIGQIGLRDYLGGVGEGLLHPQRAADAMDERGARDYNWAGQAAYGITNQPLNYVTPMAAKSIAAKLPAWAMPVVAKNLLDQGSSGMVVGAGFGSAGASKLASDAGLSEGQQQLAGLAGGLAGGLGGAKLQSVLTPTPAQIRAGKMGLKAGATAPFTGAIFDVGSHPLHGGERQIVPDSRMMPKVVTPAELQLEPWGPGIGVNGDLAAKRLAVHAPGGYNTPVAYLHVRETPGATVKVEIPGSTAQWKDFPTQEKALEWLAAKASRGEAYRPKPPEVQAQIDEATRKLEEGSRAAQATGGGDAPGGWWNSAERGDLQNKLDALQNYRESLANKRLWTHSTDRMDFDLPDPDMGVARTSSGPGTYMAGDPAISANYGDRSIISEFHGKEVNLTRVGTPDESMGQGLTSWNEAKDSLAQKLSAAANNPAEKAIIWDIMNKAFSEENLQRVGRSTKGNYEKAVGNGWANGYVYKAALEDAVESLPRIVPLFQARISSPSLLGRFKGINERRANDAALSRAIVNNHLADVGADGIFFHSQADGDVLIALTGGKAARVVAEARNAREALSKLKPATPATKAIATVSKYAEKNAPKFEEWTFPSEALKQRDVSQVVASAKEFLGRANPSRLETVLVNVPAGSSDITLVKAAEKNDAYSRLGYGHTPAVIWKNADGTWGLHAEGTSAVEAPPLPTREAAVAAAREILADTQGIITPEVKDYGAVELGGGGISKPKIGIQPEDLRMPATRRVFELVQKFPDASGKRLSALLSKRGDQSYAHSPSIADHIVATQSGNGGALWYNEITKGAMDKLENPRSGFEFSVVEGILNPQTDPIANTKLALAAMALKREMLLDGSWGSVTPDQWHARYLETYTRMEGGKASQTEPMIKGAKGAYDNGFHVQQDAVKSPSFTANLLAAAKGRISTLVTSDRWMMRANGILQIDKPTLARWGSGEALVRAAKKELKQGVFGDALKDYQASLMNALPPSGDLAHSLTGLYLGLSEKMGLLPSQVQAAEWATMQVIFKGQAKGNLFEATKWLLGEKPLAQAIADSGGMEAIKRTALSGNVWEDPAILSMADQVKALDAQLAAKGIDSYAGTELLGLENKFGIGSKVDEAQVGGAVSRGAFPEANVSFASPFPGQEMSLMEKIDLHRQHLADPTIWNTRPDGSKTFKALDDVGIAHVVTNWEKLASWEGGGEPSMTIRLEVPNEQTAQFAAAVLGKTFNQAAVGLNYPNLAAGDKVAGLHYPLPGLSTQRQYPLSEIWSSHGLDVDYGPNGYTFPNYGGPVAAHAAKVKAALIDAGLDPTKLQGYVGRGSLIAMDADPKEGQLGYDAIIARRAESLRSPAAGAAGNTYGPERVSPLSRGYDPQSFATHERLVQDTINSRIPGDPRLPDGSIGGAADAVPRIDSPAAADATAAAVESPGIGKVLDLAGNGDEVRRNPLRLLDPSTLLAEAWGKGVERFGIRGFGHLPKPLVDNPEAYDVGTRTKMLLNLKEATSDPRLPVSARISNALWKTLARFDGQEESHWLTHLDSPQVRETRLTFQTIREQIPEMADAVGAGLAMETRKFLYNADGSARLPDGSSVPFLNKHGRPLLAADGSLVPATWFDIIRAKFKDPSAYPEVDIPQAQWDDIRRMESFLGDLKAQAEAVGIKYEGAVDGLYLPRVGTEFSTKEKTPIIRAGLAAEGPRAGSTFRRQFENGADAIKAGYNVPTVYDGFVNSIQQTLDQINATHAGNRLKEIVVRGRKLGDAAPPLATEASIRDIARRIKPQLKELGQLKAKQAIADRDVRLANNWITQSVARTQQLVQHAQDVTAAADTRAAAAAEALKESKQQLRDAITAARELERAGTKLSGKLADGGHDLTKVLDEATAYSHHLNQIEDELAASMSDVAIGETSSYFSGQAQEAAKGLDFAANLRQEAAMRAAAVQKGLAALPYEDVQARYSNLVTAAADAHARFSSSLSEAQRSAMEMATAAAAEPQTAARVRAAMDQGAVNELTKVWRQRAAQLLKAHDASTEYGAHIKELADQMEPDLAHAKVLRQQVKVTRQLAFERTREGWTTLDLEPMRGVPVPAEVANAWGKVLKERVGTAGQLYDLVQNLLRMVGASFDMSRIMSVGLLGTADNPRIAAGVMGTGLRALKSADEETLNAMHRWSDYAQKNNLPAPWEAIGRDGLMAGAAENTMKGAEAPTANLTIAQRVGNVPGFKQLNASFTASGIDERLARYYKGVKELRSQGVDVSIPSALREQVAASANLISGRARTPLLSNVLGPRASSRVLFAGRFTQSQFDNVGNAILSGGIDGVDARKALIRLTVGAVGLTWAINKALGNETNMDLSDPSNFLTIRVAGTDYKLLGPWQSLAMGILKTAREVGESFNEKDPGAFLSAPADYLRTKAAPVTGYAYDLARGGKGAIGQDVMSKDYLLNNMTPVPFGVRDIGKQAMRTDFMDWTSLGALGLASAFTFMGGRQNPLSPTEELDNVSQTMFKKNYYDLSPLEQQQVKEAEPALWQEKENAQTGAAKQYNEIQAAMVKEQQASDSLALAGKISKYTWRAQYDDRRKALAAQAEVIYGPRTHKDNPKTWRDRYDNIIIDATGQDGAIDWGKVDDAVSGLSQSDQNLIDESHNLKGNTELVTLYKQAQKIRSQMKALPKYRGFTADEANDIDHWYGMLPSGNKGVKLKALNAMKGDLSDATYKGLRRRILGIMGKQLPARERFAAANPLYAQFYGAGTFAPDTLSGEAA